MVAWEVGTRHGLNEFIGCWAFSNFYVWILDTVLYFCCPLH